MSRGHAILVSQQYGLGRTNSVRLSAFLSKMKYFEARVTQSHEKSEKYIRAVLRQCCLIAGIKASNCIVYIKLEHYTYDTLENLIAFAKTGIYPDLFSEKEIWNIVNEISPHLSASKRVEKTHSVYSNFLHMIQERVHVIISLPSGLDQHELGNLFRKHSQLYTDFYVDIYKPLNVQTLNSIARYYLALQIEENRVRKLSRKYNRFDDDEDNLSLNEIQLFSSAMVDLHLIATQEYIKLYKPINKLLNYSTNKKSSFLPKPFNISMFKQLSIYFLIYMKRIKEQENFRMQKFDRIFAKLDQVNEKLKNYDAHRQILNERIDQLNKAIEQWDVKIDQQKKVFKLAVDECRKEELLVDEMRNALEKLKQDVNTESNEFNKSFTPQYQMAIKAIQCLNQECFSELKSFRSPPPQVLLVVNTLCIMFGQETGWQNGKLLLIKKGFFDDLIYYDKKNVPDSVFEHLDKVCNENEFLPELIRVGSMAAASLCAWIRAVYEYLKFERTVGLKTKQLKQYEQLYNDRLAVLGEKRIQSEKMCQKLEQFCQDRLQQIKDIKKIHLEQNKLDQEEQKANQLLKLLSEDCTNWKNEYAQSASFIQTYKMDALLTSAYVSYAAIFDQTNRQRVCNQWILTLNSLTCLQQFQQQKQELKTTNSNKAIAEIRDLVTESEKQQQQVDEIAHFAEKQKYQTESYKYGLRSNYKFKDIVINSSIDFKHLLIQLNKIGLKDEHFVDNALILRELCALPSTMSWPLIFDSHNVSIKVMGLVQESVDYLKNSLNTDYINSTPITNTSGPLKNNDGSLFAPIRNHYKNRYISSYNENNKSSNLNESNQLTEHDTSQLNIYDTSTITLSQVNYQNDNSNEDHGNTTLNQSMLMSAFESTEPNVERVESLPAFSNQSSRLSHSRLRSRESSSSSARTSERSSIWEASTFYSRSQTVATVYQTKSGRPLLDSLQASFELDVQIPPIETDLNIMPKDNMCILDASDTELEYKLVNAAVHGVAVFLKNSERYPLQSRIVEILLERDYFYNARLNKEFLKFGQEEIYISPSFKLILHVNTPIYANSDSSNNFLFHRYTTQLNPAHYILNFEPSNKFVASDFLNIIMDMEKPGYTNQMLLADKIYFESEYHIQTRQVKFFCILFIFYLLISNYFCRLVFDF